MWVNFSKISSLASFQSFTKPVIHTATTLTQFAFQTLESMTTTINRLAPDVRPKAIGVGDVVFQIKKAKSALFETSEGQVLIEITQDAQGRYRFLATTDALKPVLFLEGEEDLSGIVWEVQVSAFLQQIVALCSSVHYGVCAKRWKEENLNALKETLLFDGTLRRTEQVVRLKLPGKAPIRFKGPDADLKAEMALKFYYHKRKTPIEEAYRDLLTRLFLGFLFVSGCALVPWINNRGTLLNQGTPLEGRVLRLPDSMLNQSQVLAVQATSRKLLSQDCLSYAFPNGVTGHVSAKATGGSVVIPTADGNKTFIAMYTYSGSGSLVTISVNGNNGTEIVAPKIISNTAFMFGGGARFGDGKIAICYPTSSVQYTGYYSIYILVLNPDGSTDRTALFADNILSVKALSCTRLLNGNIEISYLFLERGGGTTFTGLILSNEVDSTTARLSYFWQNEKDGIYQQCSAVSSGQYSTGQKLVACHDKDGLQAYIFSSNGLLYKSTLIFNGEIADSTVPPVTVTTKNGPVTFWKTVGGDLHAGWVSRKNGVVTALSIDDGGLVGAVKVETNYDPKNPNQPEYLAVMFENGGTLVVRVLDALTLATTGCDTPINTVTVGSGGMMSVAFFPDQQTLRTVWYQSGSSMNITDFKLNQPPIAAPVLPQNGTIGEFKCVSSSAQDLNGHPLTWSFGFNGGALPSGFTTTQGNGTATICWNLPQGFVRGMQALNISINNGFYNGETSFSVPFNVLNRNPTIVSGPTGTQTVYSNTPPQTVWSYIVTGTDPDGDVLKVYLDPATDPAVSANGKYLTMTVTPADVGRTIVINYNVEDNFGGISPPQSVTFVVVDRFPVVNPFVFPDATAGVYYSYNLPGNTFTEPDGQATEQSFKDLPEGLKYTPTTNTVDGIPLEASMTTMTKTKVFVVSVSNSQTANGLTTTQYINLPVKPNPLTERSRLVNVNAIVGLVFGSIAGAGIFLNGVIASRIIRYKAPDKWKEHQRRSLSIRIIKVFGSSFSICFIPAARTKAQEKYDLNFWGGKKKRVSLEMGSMGRSGDKTEPLLSDDGS